MLLDIRSLPMVTRYTWRRHWRASVWMGLSDGIAGLAAFAAMRSLGAGPWVAPLIVVASQAPWTLAPAFERLQSREKPRRVFKGTALAMLVAASVAAFVDVRPVVDGPSGAGTGQVWLFVAGIVATQIVACAYLAHRGALIRTNYAEAARGRVFGWLQTISRMTAVVSSKCAGFLLDLDPRFLRVVFPLVGVFAYLEQMKLSRIHWRRARRDHPRIPASGWLRDSLHTTVALLREDRRFLIFEVAFMLYGIGFLAAIPLLPVFAESALQVSYDEWTWAQGVSQPLAMIAVMTPAGRLMDRIGVMRTTGISFALLVVFLVLAPFVTTAVELVVLFTLWGAAMAGVMMSWNLGPLHFAPEGRGRRYAAVHLFMVGIRSMIGPPLGYFLAVTVSLKSVFFVAAGLMALAVVTVWRVREPRRVPAS